MSEKPAPLPCLMVSIKCENCYNEVDHDGDAFHCDHCKIQWATTDPFDEKPGEFRDEEDGVCGYAEGGDHRDGDIQTLAPGEQAPRHWAPGARGRRFSYTLHPCILPAGHPSEEHFRPHTGWFTWYDADGQEVPDVAP